jgi:hypothetical protein
LKRCTLQSVKMDHKLHGTAHEEETFFLRLLRQHDVKMTRGTHLEQSKDSSTETSYFWCPTHPRASLYQYVAHREETKGAKCTVETLISRGRRMFTNPVDT